MGKSSGLRGNSYGALSTSPSCDLDVIWTYEGHFEFPHRIDLRDLVFSSCSFRFQIHNLSDISTSSLPLVTSPHFLAIGVQEHGQRQNRRSRNYAQLHIYYYWWTNK